MSVYLQRIGRFLSARLKGQPNPYKVWWVNPASIEYVTPPSVFTDLNQHEANRDHPHAYYNRGYFREPVRIGMILDGNWDQADLKIANLLEFIAIKEMLLGKTRWRDSRFAQRGANFIRLGGTSKGYTDPDIFLAEREKEVMALTDGIKRDGIRPAADSIFQEGALDQISVNVSRNGELLFNNRGLHRLSIAKLIRLQFIPVLVVVWHKQWIGKMGFALNHAQ